MWPLRRRDHVGLVEVVADEAEAALGMEVVAVVGDDAGGLLAAMLQGVQAERGQRGGIVAEDAEDPALLAEPVIAVSRIAGTIELRRRHRLRRAVAMAASRSGPYAAALPVRTAHRAIGDALPAQLLPTGPVCHVTTYMILAAGLPPHVCVLVKETQSLVLLLPRAGAVRDEACSDAAPAGAYRLSP